MSLSQPKLDTDGGAKTRLSLGPTKGAGYSAHGLIRRSTTRVMTEFFYHSPMVDEAREKSRSVWDQMAPGWESTRDFMWTTTHHVAEWLVDKVQIQVGDVILDVAGGPGDNGFLAAQRVGPSGRVIETDFAPEMVAVAQRRAIELNLDNVQTRVLDAEKMDLDDDSVDGIICRWGFMLMLDPGAALKECRRVLKDGRRLALSVWGSPERNPWVTVVGATMRALGYPTPGDPLGPGGMFSMAEREQIGGMLNENGFTNISIEEMGVAWKYSSFDEAWSFMTRVAGPIAALLKELPVEETETLRNTLKGNLEQFRAGDGLSLPGLTMNAYAS